MTCSKLKACLFAACACAATQTAALPVKVTERAELFAVCSGRLEALAVRRRSFQEENAEVLTHLHTQFDALLEAVLPDAVSQGVDAVQARRWQNRGWTEVAYLLANIDYGLDQTTVDHLQGLLNRKISVCRDILL